MKRLAIYLLLLWVQVAPADIRATEAPVTLVVATVDNGHMLQLRALSNEFEKLHPSIKLRWVTLPEGDLRKVVHSDIQTQMHRFDVVTVGMYEVPIWAAKGWLAPIRPPPGYGVEDLIDNIREGLSYQGDLYAAPFYGESSMLYYRKDLFAKAGLAMPARPTWADLAGFAERLHDRAAGVHGICLRARPGWGENMTLVATMANAFGGQWFGMQWRPRLQSPAWKEAVSLYVNLLQRYGPSDAIERGYNGNLELFNSGRCAQWVDATVAAGFVANRELNPHAAHVGFAPAPTAVTSKGARWLWAWALAIPKGAVVRRASAAQTFVAWATSRDYVRRVAAERGWGLVPAGNRKSTYAEPGFRAAAPWAGDELEAIRMADPNDATLEPSPYLGVQFAAVGEFASIGDAFGQAIADAVSGRTSVDNALARGQSVAERFLALQALPSTQRRSKPQSSEQPGKRP